MIGKPSARRFLEARWLDLVMLSYSVDPTLLAELVPGGTELDLWQGRSLVSMVGFRFLDTRVLGWSIPLHRHFEEVNLRFYVRRVAGDELRRGVVFVKEVVPRRAIAWVANTLYNERYVALPTRQVEGGNGSRRRVGYEWRAYGRWHRLEASVEGQPELPPPDSEEAFISEHYWGYAAQRDGSTLEYRVEHPQWRVWRATEHSFECDVASMYGTSLAPFLRDSPESAFVAEGSPVLVRRGSRL